MRDRYFTALAAAFMGFAVLLGPSTASAWEHRAEVSGGLDRSDRTMVVELSELYRAIHNDQPVHVSHLSNGDVIEFLPRGVSRVSKQSSGATCITTFGSPVLICGRDGFVRACVGQEDGTNHCSVRRGTLGRG